MERCDGDAEGIEEFMGRGKGIGKNSEEGLVSDAHVEFLS